MSASIFRASANAAQSAFRGRAFASTQAARRGKIVVTSRDRTVPNVPADIIQDLYLRELRSYKPAVAAKDAHVGLVKTFSQPVVPKAPTLPVDLAAELAAYDAAEPVLAEVSTTSSGPEAGSGAEAYLSFLEQDVPKAEAHH